MDLKHKLTSGALWMVGARLSVRTLGLISTVILARLLLPEDFGLIAVATSIVAVLAALSTFSFDQTLIADREATRSEYDSAWSMTIIKSVVSATILIICAKPVAIFFDEPRLESVVYVLSICQAIRGFENIGIVDFRRDLHFDREFAFQFWSKLGGFTATMTAAFLLRDYRALLVGTLFHATWQLSLSYGMSSYRPHWSLKSWRPIMMFSKWLLLNNVLAFLNRRSATFILGKTSGIGATGIYSMASEIGTLLTTELVWPIQRAIFPGYATISDDQEQLRSAYISVLAIILAIGLPIGVGIAICSNEIVRIVLGEKWLEAIPLIALLSLAGTLSLMTANAGSVMLAMKKPRLITTISALVVAIRIPALVYGASNWGLLGAAYAMLATSFVAVVANISVITNLLGIPLSIILSNIWRSFFATGTMAAAIATVGTQLPMAQSFTDSVVRLVFLVSVGATVYLASLALVWATSGKPAGAESHILGWALSLLNKDTSRAAQG